jgi:hypothetical protein
MPTPTYDPNELLFTELLAMDVYHRDVNGGLIRLVDGLPYIDGATASGAGRAGQSVIENYKVDVETGKATANVLVAGSEATLRKLTVNELKEVVNMVLKAGFGTGIFGTEPLVRNLNGDGRIARSRDRRRRRARSRPVRAPRVTSRNGSANMMALSVQQRADQP